MTARIEKEAVAVVDPVWRALRADAEAMSAADPIARAMVQMAILPHASFEAALGVRLARKLATPDVPESALAAVFAGVLATNPHIGVAARADLSAVHDRDPACHRPLDAFLYFKGFHALSAYRIGHALLGQGRRDLALYIQMRVSELFSVDIHPGARIGRGIMIDHAHAVVIGETAVVGDNVSLLHGVTLGGTGKEDGDRHPKIGSGVLIGAGAKILGNISVGSCSRVAAGSVVLSDVPPCKTVAGVPARIVGDAGCSNPSQAMDHRVNAPAIADDIVPDC
jgi:serine O-acetyltransferase